MQEAKKWWRCEWSKCYPTCTHTHTQWHTWAYHNSSIGCTLKKSDLSFTHAHDVNGIIRGYQYQVSYTSHGESKWLHDVAKNTTSTELTGLRPHQGISSGTSIGKWEQLLPSVPYRVIC